MSNKLTAQENMDLFCCLSVGGLYPEDMFAKDCLKWMQSFSAKQEVMDNIYEMIEIEEDITNENREQAYIDSLKGLAKKIPMMAEIDLHEILKKYMEHFSFFDRTRMLN